MGMILLPIVIILLGYCAFTVAYLYFLAGAYFLLKDDERNAGDPCHTFCILVPAHNEEMLLGRLLESLRKVAYPPGMFTVTVIADNCNDRTAAIARENGVECLERSAPELRGKGYALDWAMERIRLDEYHAVLIIDADTRVEPDILRELDSSLTCGARIVQCHNALGNPEVSWLTRLQHIMRVIDNTLVHYAKHKLGWSSFLMGNGMCLTRDIIRRYPWRSVSLCEDFEYYTHLILNDECIDFNYQAKVFHQESSSLDQAYTQRSRWSAGKFQLMRTRALRLLWHGIRRRSLRGIEASFVLLLPHPSLLCNLTAGAFILSFLLPAAWIIASAILILLEMAYFIMGLILAKASPRTVLSFFYAPLYLAWKALVDVGNLIGLGAKEWRRTARIE